MSVLKFKRDRPTIGILTGRSILEGTLRDHYRASVLRGIQFAAQTRQCHLLLAWGIRPSVDVKHVYSTWPVVSHESDFVPVGPWNSDGLIVFTPVGNEDRSLYLQKLIAEGYPIIFIATGEQGSRISVNNEAGIRQAMAHLVEHGHRSVAFIAGIPTDKGDSEIRLRAYHTAVTEYSLEVDPRLVVWGWHIFTEGYRAMQTLLASGVKFTAVLASNDASAVGAMQAIREANLRIPADIAVMGFDDQPSAVAQVPPLSSMRAPLKLMGEQALIMMADHLMKQTPLESIQVSTPIVRRQSCGCIPEVVSSALNGTAQTKPVSFYQNQKHLSIQERQKQVVNEMLTVLPSMLRFPGEEEVHETCRTLVQAFCKSLDEMTPVYFQTAFIHSISELERLDRSIDPWQEMISVLRREMTRLPLKWDNSKTRRLAEDLLHQARAAVGESAERQDQRHQYQRVVESLALNALTAHLSVALSEKQMVEVLNIHLPETGIRHVRVIFFEAEQDDPVAWSVALNVGMEQTSLRFPSRQFPPPELYEPDELLNIILLPLVFQNETIGYIVFDAINNLGDCAVIAMQLAATIKVARLHSQVVELSLTDALTGLHNRRSFEIFLKNEVSRSKRFFRVLAIILVDVDNFKEYNDTYGHPAGDEALQQVAKCLLAGRRSADIVARIGGDEFVIILPETELDGALEVSRRLREMVMASSELKRPLSVSIGLTAPNTSGMDAESVIRQADLALYESKRKGRNCISVFTHAGVTDEKEFPSLV